MLSWNTFAKYMSWKKCSQKFFFNIPHQQCCVKEHTEHRKIFELQAHYWTKLKYENLKVFLGVEI
jgi:hypothetical protein